jgi:hypothetical protein
LHARAIVSSARTRSRVVGRGMGFSGRMATVNRRKRIKRTTVIAWFTPGRYGGTPGAAAPTY